MEQTFNIRSMKRINRVDEYDRLYEYTFINKNIILFFENDIWHCLG